MPQTSDMPILSVPFGIAFGEEKFSPWTIGLHRYRFYSAPRIEMAIPEEVRIGKFAEVYLKAYDDKQFFERKSTPFLSLTVLFSPTNTKRKRCNCHVVPVGAVRNEYGHVRQRDICHVRHPAHQWKTRGLLQRDGQRGGRHERIRFCRCGKRRLRDFHRHRLRQGHSDFLGCHSAACAADSGLFIPLHGCARQQRLAGKAA